MKLFFLVTKFETNKIVLVPGNNSWVFSFVHYTKTKKFPPTNTLAYSSKHRGRDKAFDLQKLVFVEKSVELSLQPFLAFLGLLGSML
jgi:hypothetical protein